MKAIIVRNYLRPGRVGHLHSVFFHGLGERAGVTPLETDCSFLDHRQKNPFLLSRNIYHVPDIFSPSATLIVSERVKLVLAGVKNLEFEAVQFKHLCNIPYQIGLFTLPGDTALNKPGKDMNRVLRSSPRVSPPSSLLPYYELITARHFVISGRYSDRRSCSFYDGDHEEENLETLDLSPRMLVDYPIIMTPFGIVFEANSYDLISHYLDPDYFAQSEIEIDETVAT